MIHHLTERKTLSTSKYFTIRRLNSQAMDELWCWWLNWGLPTTKSGKMVILTNSHGSHGMSWEYLETYWQSFTYTRFVCMCANVCSFTWAPIKILYISVFIAFGGLSALAKKQCFVHISDKSFCNTGVVFNHFDHNSCVYEPYVRMSRWVYAGSRYEVKLQCVDSRAFDRLWVENQPNPSISCICYPWVFIVSPWFPHVFPIFSWPKNGG